MSAERKQSGLAHEYTEWVAEDEVGVTPTDPSFQPFSDNVRTVWDGEPDASTEAQRGLGDRDPKGFYNGPEEHEFTFVYDLQQWYVDSSGNIQDPAGSIMYEAEDNDVFSTHTVVSKEAHVTGGTADQGRSIFTVGKGGYPSELTVPFETEDGLPVQQEFTYRFEKVREYSVSQPPDNSVLAVVSTSSDDTSQTVTLESESGTSEDVDLNGTTAVEATTEFSSISAVELSDECQGDVQVGISDGASVPAIETQLVEVLGVNSYGGIEGDLGIPAVGGGSRASSVGTEYIRFRQDVLHYEGGETIAPEVISGELAIDNGIDATGKAHTTRQSIDIGQRETTLSASLAGPKATVDQMRDYLRENKQTVEWIPETDAGDHNLLLDNARLVTPGSIARETDQAKLVVEAEFQSEGITVN